MEAFYLLSRYRDWIYISCKIYKTSVPSLLSCTYHDGPIRPFITLNTFTLKNNKQIVGNTIITSTKTHASFDFDDGHTYMILDLLQPVIILKCICLWLSAHPILAYPNFKINKHRVVNDNYIFRKQFILWFLAWTSF